MFSSIILAVFSIIVLVYVRKKPRRTLPLPPGPRKYPIIGNLLVVPDESHWVAYDRIAKECNSDIIHFSVFGNSVIVLNSFAAASDVLDRQSSISSSRPEGTMINEVMGWKSMFSVQPYGQQWRDHRKVFWQEFHPEHGRLHHRPIQLRCSRDLIRRLYESPLDFQTHIRHMTASSILVVVYGVDVQEKDDPNITLVENALKHLDLGFIGTYMVDIFPFLKHIPRWIPGAGFQIIGRNATRDLNLLVDVPYSQTRRLLTEGRGESSLIYRALSRGSIPDGGKEECIIKNTAATAYLGANETSKFSMTLFVALMALNPDIQKRAQRELDQYLNHRLPEFEDEDYLPYTFAVMLEVLRLEPITPLGLPRSLVSDGEYKGYHLPGGSVVFCNLWYSSPSLSRISRLTYPRAILRDETVFSEPGEFIPSRFLKDGQIDPSLKDYFMTAFGFGRRICPGRYFAMDNLWLNMASILSVYTIGKAVDEDGQEIDITPEYTTNLNRMGWNPVFSVQPYGQRWRDRRRVFWQEFNPEQGKVNHRPIQLYYTRDLIRRIHEAPLDFQEHIYYTIGASILAIVYGLNIQEREDPNIAIAKNALHHLGATAITGTFIVDHLPILKHLPRWIPGAGFRILGDNSTRDMNLLIDGPYSEARKLLETGRGQPSFLERAFHRRSKIDGGMNFNELVIKETAAAAYLGGSETTQFAVSLFVGAMVLWPDVQAKAQEELDQYLDHRLPDFDDQPHLPYTLALMLEIMRWEPVGPLGLPHSLVDDDEYKGYHLPKDSVVFFNAWAILRDNTVFPEPERFNPSRFLINGEIDIGLRDYVMSVFGFGRRVCPGRHFAQDTLWITIASILTVFTISNATDEGGQPIVPDLKYTADLVRHVLPFKCSIKPRSDKAAELIERFCRS
ncbi:hypothetical protein CCMSSC00406_0007271 [Pleurotus cornucopiae]|uniref:Uncharacterized protein n=1 Tax=Pleurotus cornucopiae TaxID=5321 RepID=A0ACB7ILA9_PLECO|nr:hypothetical protein CCMSSC00406_0007271 [Pleurotus cornucopiae]